MCFALFGSLHVSDSMSWGQVTDESSSPTSGLRQLGQVRSEFVWSHCSVALFVEIMYFYCRLRKSYPIVGGRTVRLATVTHRTKSLGREARGGGYIFKPRARRPVTTVLTSHGQPCSGGLRPQWATIAGDRALWQRHWPVAARPSKTLQAQQGPNCPPERPRNSAACHMQ